MGNHAIRWAGGLLTGLAAIAVLAAAGASPAAGEAPELARAGGADMITRSGIESGVHLAQNEGSEGSGAQEEEFTPERPGRTGLPLPRFVSLRNDKVNMRAGPGVRYPIEWVYHRRGLPVEIIDEFGNWRRIRDWEGDLGWVHSSMLSGRRTFRVTGEPRILRREPAENAPAVAKLMPGVVGELDSCNGSWCRLSADGYEGWLQREEFYGVYPRETVD